jgi:hypothetical protein
MKQICKNLRKDGERYYCVKRGRVVCPVDAVTSCRAIPRDFWNVCVTSHKKPLLSKSAKTRW